MKILVIGSLPASLCNFRGPLLESLLARGHSLHVAAPGILQDEPTCQWLRDRQITIHDIKMARTGLNPIADLGTLIDLFRLCRQVKPDVVLSYTIKPVIWGMLAAWLARVPNRFALITGLGYAFTAKATSGRRALVRTLAQRLYASALRRTKLIMFQNPDDRQDFADLGILYSAAKTLIVNGSGVDTQAFASADLPDGPVQFLLIARLLGDKGIREYAAAANQLRPQGLAEFHLVGPLDTNPDGLPEDLIHSWQQSGILQWHGSVSDVRPSIRKAHVYVLPSYREGTPRTVLEAMSMGRPIITTDAPGCRETVEQGVNGFLVQVADTEALAKAMQKFIDDPSLIVQMGSNSRQLAEEKYEVHKVNSAMIEAMGI